jgi:hypothetical protein
MSDHASRVDPIFILATPRSYSTVTTAILAGHPVIHGFPELLLNRGHTVGDAFAADLAKENLPWQLGGLCRAVADLHEGYQSDDSMERARKWLAERTTWTTKQVMEYLLSAVYPQIGLEKSSVTVKTDEALELCLSGYPNARYIHLTRHPVTAQGSMLRQWLEMFKDDQMPQRDDRLLAARMAELWFSANYRVVRVLLGLPAEQWIRVRAEDILRHPHVLLPKILNWLQLYWDDSIIARMLITERWKFADRYSESSHLGGGDPKFFESPALRDIPEPGPLIFDPAWDLSEQATSRMSWLANYFGY